MSKQIVEQQDIIDLLEKAEIDPEDVQTVHLNWEDSWAEVVVRDEKGTRVVKSFDWETETGLYVTTIIPLAIRSRHSKQVI